MLLKCLEGAHFYQQLHIGTLSDPLPPRNALHVVRSYVHLMDKERTSDKGIVQIVFCVGGRRLGGCTGKENRSCLFKGVGRISDSMNFETSEGSSAAI
ncbi:hypothetical protein CDAR_611421 [Caerostris darwini]|uniref:Uncharacterized protein n=1 Tax=Caerostris darwini TaxID=1538125 RepID=A0AAV4UQH6_9ARAC|nr:hypothetical protein CDAR_611421 [Caerostris darwini]